MDLTISWAREVGEKIPFICAANEKRPGGDWETGVVGYAASRVHLIPLPPGVTPNTKQERLCRRSNLSVTLATPGPNSYADENYPIPIEGGILSETVGKPLASLRPFSHP